MTDATDAASQDTTADDLDTPDAGDGAGDRDPLATDDGLAAAADGMPAVPEDQPVDGHTGSGILSVPVAAPGLELDDAGVDPLAGLGEPGTADV